MTDRNKMKRHTLQQTINAVKDKQWRKRGHWPQNALFAEIWGRGESTPFQQRLGYPFTRKMMAWYNNDYFDLVEDWEQALRIVEEEYSKSPRYLFTYADHCLRLGEQLMTFSENVTEDVHVLSHEELGELFGAIITRLTEYQPFLYSVHPIDLILSKKFERLLHEYIEKNNKSKEYFFEYQLALTFPYRKIFVMEEKQAIMKLATSIQEGKKISLEKHWKKYRWINMVYLEKEPYTQEDFRKRLDELLTKDSIQEYKSIVRDETKLVQQQERYMKEIGGTELHTIAKAVQIFGFLRSYRLDVTYIALCNCWHVVEEITARLSLPVLDIQYLMSDEIKKALVEKGDYNRLIMQRKEGMLVIAQEDTIMIFTGKDKDSILPHITFPEVIVSTTLTGNTAYPGNVTGTCKVLRNMKDIDKIKKGDILVIAMTDPNYLPAMEKAAAFVTDQGGILCHAAIVSREMKKPCIIGTKVATRAYQDGDILEVDADEGVVRKISQ